MSGLKRLISPTKLAATIASAMLVAAAATELAESYSQLGEYPAPTCDANHQLCSGWGNNRYGVIYWCCLDYTHGYQCGHSDGTYGWCDPYPPQMTAAPAAIIRRLPLHVATE